MTKLQAKEHGIHQAQRTLELRQLQLRVTREKWERRIVAEQARRSAAVSKLMLVISKLEHRIYGLQVQANVLAGKP